jgi:DNA replicative helicase MCM subunit Mcm2 (Cdc46/Mcm family)
MGIKRIKVRINNKKIIKELDTELSLTEIRKLLLDDVLFPFIFLNEDEEEIQKDKESHTKLEDILDGKNLYLQKEKIIRKMLGEKIETKNGLDIYLFPQRELTEIEKRRSSNIMVFGETGVGKSAWLHCFLNYLQGIQIEENNRYYLFNEKQMRL